MKQTFILIIFIIISASTIAQDRVDYKIPKKLDVEDFQIPEDKAFLEKFDNIKIPALMRKMLKTDEEHIIPFLRQKTADVYDSQITLKIMRQGTLVTDKQFAWIKKEVDTCAQLLHLSSPPRIFIVGEGGMKARVVNFKDPFIVLPAKLVEKLDAQALRFAIGRQIGHIKCDHVFYQTLFSGGLDSLELVLGKWVAEAIQKSLDRVTDLILVDWTLAREISADRAGLIACQNLQVAQETLLNFKLGMSIEKAKFNIEDSLEQARIIEEKQALAVKNLPKSVQKGFARWRNANQLEVDHPFIFKRISAIQEYAESATYRQLFE